jgi:hypothetical protein
MSTDDTRPMQPPQWAGQQQPQYGDPEYAGPPQRYGEPQDSRPGTEPQDDRPGFGTPASRTPEYGTPGYG